MAIEKPTRVQVATNRRARYDYEIEDELEAGMVLTGTEVKSLRDGKAELQDGYAEIEHGELFLNQVHIPEYRQGNVFNHEPRRRRKLLAHREQIDRLHRKVTEKGYTLVPLELYFSSGRAKVKLGLARGKKKYDKRESVKARDVRRELERE